MDFPYDIRLVDVGTMVRVPNGTNTVAYAVWYDENFVHCEGARRPARSRWGWLISSIALMSEDDDRKKLLTMAKNGIESLPDLAHKFMLVYHRGERMFDNCYLVATDDQDWWQEYEVIR